MYNYFNKTYFIYIQNTIHIKISEKLYLSILNNNCIYDRFRLKVKYDIIHMYDMRLILNNICEYSYIIASCLNYFKIINPKTIF